MSEIQGRLFDFHPFGARDPSEEHRSATPLELFFDLVFVIAIAAAAQGLHHGLAENHALQVIPVFLLAFVAIWWAWMNYTWYASAYDNDGPVFRLLTFWIMGGALLLAASVSSFFDGLDLVLPAIAYVIMRIGVVALWAIAARHAPAQAVTAKRYAYGTILVQIFWVLLAIFGEAETWLFIALIILGWTAEFLVPVYAERAAATPWHNDHIVERYGLLMIILLGETLLAGSLALAQAGDDLALNSPQLRIAIVALIVAFSMWWLYFSRDDHLRVHTHEKSLEFVWGYGHAVPFCAVAAIGASFALLADIASGHAEVSPRVGDIAVAAPLAIYMAGLWFIRDRFVLCGAAKHILLPFAVIILLTGLFLPAALEIIAVLCVASVWFRSFFATRERRKLAAEA